MEFTQEILEKMEDKQKYNVLFGNWYFGLSEEIKSVTLYKSNIIKKRGNRISNCLDYWDWDIYYKNELMDLQKVNRCMNNRFCPNCKKFELAKFIHHFGKNFNQLLKEQYNPYLITLTIPNVKGTELKETIEYMNKAFSKFFRLFNEDVGQGKHGFRNRIMKIDGALKVLEITHNIKTNMFHPHFHIMAFSKEYPEGDLKKIYKGAWSNKRESFDLNSEMDIQIMKLWYMCYNKIKLSEKEYSKISDNWYDLYLCDIREMDENGVYEVLKYTFKDTDVKNYYVFKTLVSSLESKRIRQGYGILRGLKCEDIEDGDVQGLDEYLKIDKKETPDKLLTKGLKTIIIEYTKYKKISRFKSYKELESLD